MVKGHSVWSVLALMGLFHNSQVLAQDNTDDSGDQKIEKISVTGSYIKKIDVEGIAPLETISNEEFTKRGAVEIGDVFRETPAFESVYSDGGHVRFRGQHAGNVLILLNGLRMPKLDGGYYTSIRDLPTAAIGNVEMLKDSGSAIYGSDAMSGVINFKTKKDYTGAEVQTSVMRSEMTSEGSQQNVSATYGKTFGRGNIMGVLQFENTKALTETTLGSYLVDSRDRYGNSNESNIDFGDNNTYEVGPDCNSGSGTCQSNPLYYDQARPKNHDISALLTGTYEFDGFDGSLLLLVNRNKTTTLSNPQTVKWLDGLGTSINTSDIQTSSYSSQANSYASGGTLEIDGSFVSELGEYVTEKERMTYSLQGGLNGYFGTSDWSWEVQSGISIADYKGTVVSGEANQNELKTLFQNGDFNMFAEPGSKSDVSSAKIQPVYRNNSFLFQTRGVVTGDIFDLSSLYSAGGMVSMAAGAEIQKEDFEFDNDASLSNGAALAQTSENFEGGRDIESAFMEFSITPHEKVEVSLASRYDHYSDMGSTFNPKLGVSYRPFNFLMLRSSVGSGFRAPGITDVYSKESTSLTRFYDAVGGSSDYYNVTEYNSSSIEAEEALTYNFGLVAQPFKDVTFLVDQWNYEGENVITSLDADDYTDIENQYGASVLDGLGVTSTRSGTTLESMRIPNVINLGKRTLRGLDVQLDAKFKLFDDFDLKIGSGLMYIFERSDQRFDFENKIEYKSSWKNRSYIAVYNRAHYVRLAMLTVSRDTQNQGRSTETTIPSYYELDLNYSYTWNWGGKINFTIKNLANTRPQPNKNYDPVTYGYLSQGQSSFSPLRRRYYVGYTHTF